MSRRPGATPTESFRRTLVGLKRREIAAEELDEKSFRRTLVGLKRRRGRQRDLGATRFRRTLVGLKLVWTVCTVGEACVSDEPSWG